MASGCLSPGMGKISRSSTKPALEGRRHLIQSDQRCSPLIRLPGLRGPQKMQGRGPGPARSSFLAVISSANYAQAALICSTSPTPTSLLKRQPLSTDALFQRRGFGPLVSQLSLTRDRLDNLVHIGTVRVVRALHHRRWSRRWWRRRPRAGEGKAARTERGGC
jgi:hypothetical protein